MLLKFTLKIVKFIKAIAVANLRPSSSMQWLEFSMVLILEFFPFRSNNRLKVGNIRTETETVNSCIASVNE